MNYLKISLIASLLLLTSVSRAQNSFTLQQCVDYALTNSPTIKNSQLDLDIAKAKVKETTAIGLPQINGKWDLLHNINVQQNFVPNDPNSPFYTPLLPDGESIAFGLGINYSSNANATLTQLIFDGSYLVGLQAAKTYTELAEQGIAKSKEEVVINVKKAYYMMLVTQKRMLQVTENQKLLEQLMDDTKALTEAGFAESIDAKRVTVNLNNLLVEIEKLKSFEAISMNMLKFQMGMSVNETITLTESLESRVAEMTTSKPTNNFESRSEFKMIEVQNELNALNLKNEKIKLLPSLAAFGTLGMNYGNNELGNVFNFGDYQDYSMVGLSLNVPIWSSGQRKFRIDQAKAESKKSQNDREMLMNSFELESSQAESTLNNNVKVLKVREDNMKLAEEVYENSQIKYKEGVGSSFEVTSAQTDLKTAQTDYYSALYDAIISKIDLEKANGQLIVE